MKPLAISGGQLVEVADALALTYGIPGVLAVGVGAARWYPQRNITILGVVPAAGIAPTGASLLFDLNIDGATAFSTQANRPAVASGSYSGSAAVPNVVDVNEGSYLTLDVDQVGSTVAGSHATVQVLYRWRT